MKMPLGYYQNDLGMVAMIQLEMMRDGECYQR